MAFTARSGSQARTQTALAEINITPLVDVVLVLLLIFMISAPVLQSGLEVAIPKTRTVNALSEERMVVTINKDQKRLPAGQADQRQRPSHASCGQPSPAIRPRRVIYVRADEQVPFGAFASVMDAVKQAGITNISIVTRPLDK